MTMFNFTPSDPKKEGVPFFEDVQAFDGWQGHTTSKSLEALKSEITAAIGRLDGMVIAFRRGKHQEPDRPVREGFQVHYTMLVNGRSVPGRIDIAALPIRPHKSTRHRYNSSPVTQEERFLRMALFMFREALKGLWFLRMLAPGFAPLIAWVLVDNSRTVSQLLMSESSPLKALPGPQSSGKEPIEGSWVE